MNKWRPHRASHENVQNKQLSIHWNEDEGVAESNSDPGQIGGERNALQARLLPQLDLHPEPSQYHHRAIPADKRCARPGRPHRSREPAMEKNGIRKKVHSSDVITDLTLDWLKSGRDTENPFFLIYH
jgi:hypothetical protein|tara:strand:+ start:10532 stop:10912 length:381 start_codon:yes stop_codon:yes gene_type:complete